MIECLDWSFSCKDCPCIFVCRADLDSHLHAHRAVVEKAWRQKENGGETLRAELDPMLAQRLRDYGDLHENGFFYKLYGSYPNQVIFRIRQ